MKEKQLYLDMLKQKNNLENSLDKIKKENDTLKIEKEDLENIKERITKVNEKDNLNEEDFYDISIEIKSIKDLQKGWKLIMNDKGKNTYEKNKNKLLLRIGAIGNSKKGKSFLLNKISHIDLMIGVSIQSSGLNIKYPETEEHSQIIILDSAGLEKPLLKENKNMIENENDEDNENKVDQKNDINLNEENLKKEFQDMSKDKIITELFLQKFIIKSSDILLLVVGSLTYSEQLLINKVKEQCKLLQKERLIIVHNLQYFRKIEQVKQYIDNTLLKCETFNLIKPNLIDINMNINKNIEKEQNEKNNIEEKDIKIKTKEKDDCKDKKEENIINNDKEIKISRKKKK
jgi:hypothetical protein